MKQQWTVEYRNWIGATPRGLIFLRARQGRGKWRKGKDIPPHVAQYIHLEPWERMWVLRGITEQSMVEGGAVTFAKRIPGRVHCQIEAPKVEPKVKSYAPTSVGRAFPNHDSPWHLYRCKYKYTDCGPSLGAHLIDKKGVASTVYGSSMPHLFRTGRGLKTEVDGWQHWQEEGFKITGFTVGSIVEGVEQCCEDIEVPCYPLATLSQRLDEAVTAVDDEAKDIWDATHGCRKCGPENETGYRAINPTCRRCKGQGTIL